MQQADTRHKRHRRRPRTPVNTFGQAKYDPAYIFVDNLGANTKAIAEAASHEVGHRFGLAHDGVRNADGSVNEYYTGKGLFAPIMGTSYYRPSEPGGGRRARSAAASPPRPPLARAQHLLASHAPCCPRRPRQPAPRQGLSSRRAPQTGPPDPPPLDAPLPTRPRSQPVVQGGV